MALYTHWMMPDSVMIELGKMALDEPGFSEYFQELARQDFFLEYEEDRYCKTEKEFHNLVRRRWDAMKLAWSLHKRNVLREGLNSG